MSVKLAPVARTSAGLRDALFDAIEALKAGEMPADEAKALAILSREICNTVHLEIKVAQLRNEYPADAKLVIPGPLNLGEATKAIEKK